MEFTLKSGRKIKMVKDISLDQRDELMDSVQYDLKEDGRLSGIRMINATLTKWLRVCLDGDTSDKALMKWSIDERTEAFVEFQKVLTAGEEKASK